MTFKLFAGRMISSSKTSPKGHVCVFNANLCTKSKGKFWFGDLDLTDDIEQLRIAASEQGENVYVLREMDARFRNEAEPKFENAIACIEPNGNFHFLKS
jgi:hypothetical protein